MNVCISGLAAASAAASFGYPVLQTSAFSLSKASRSRIARIHREYPRRQRTGLVSFAFACSKLWTSRVLPGTSGRSS